MPRFQKKLMPNRRKKGCRPASINTMSVTATYDYIIHVRDQATTHDTQSVSPRNKKRHWEQPSVVIAKIKCQLPKKSKLH